MKYKRKYMEQIKEKYGVTGLHFYNGQKINKNRDIFRHEGSIFVCSKRRLYKRKTINLLEEQVMVDRRLTAIELSNLLAEVDNAELQRYKRRPTKIWFEHTNTEYIHLEELKRDYFILNLSGLL